MANITFNKSKLQTLLNQQGLTAYAADMRCGFVRKNGRPSGQVNAILRGYRCPNAETLANLAAGLGVPMEYFFEKSSATS